MVQSYTSCLIIFFILHLALNGNAEKQQQHPNEIHPEQSCQAKPSSCQLYIAQSTIPNAGLGIFSAVAHHAGDKIGGGDICVPIIEPRWNHPSHSNHIINPLYDYVWSGPIMGMSRESVSDDIEAFCMGLDAAVNCHLGLINAQKAVPLYYYEETVSSPYASGSATVTRDIPAGAELFKFYGDAWFVARQETLGAIPLTEDYDRAQDLLGSLLEHIPSQLQRETYENMILELPDIWTSSTFLHALPRNWTQARQVAAKMTSLSQILQPNHTRSLEWLQEHGRCVDNIRVANSTVSGRGAFATRNLPEGSLVTTSPLLHFVGDELFRIYNRTQLDDDTFYRHIDQRISYQPLLNYCFENTRLSPVILCPYGVGVNAINHDTERVNVKIRWAAGGFFAHDSQVVSSWTLEQLKAHPASLLAFDYITIRDVAEGEELFMDYGEVWQERWDDFVETTGRNVSRRVSAEKYNIFFPDSSLRTMDEQELDPYPNNWQLRCHEHLLLKYESNVDLMNVTWSSSDYGHACRILDRFVEPLYNHSILYTVELEIEQDDDEVAWIIQTDVPRQAIRFFDQPGTTALHNPDSFRHAIGLPEYLIPPRWYYEEEDDEEEEYFTGEEEEDEDYFDGKEDASDEDENVVIHL